MATGGEGYVTPMEAARLAGFSRKHVYELLTTGKLPAAKVWGGRWRIRLEDVKALKASREIGVAR
jgi:excisionase family DNA binding protein